MALDSRLETPITVDDLPNLNQFQKAQFSLIYVLILRLQQTQVLRMDLLKLLFNRDNQPFNDSQTQVLIAELQKHVKTNTQAEFISLVKGVSQLRQWLVNHILWMDALKQVYGEIDKDDIDFWQEHDAVRAQLFKNYQSVAQLLNAYHTYGKAAADNHASAMLIPGLTYATVFILMPLLAFGAVIATSYWATTFNPGLASATLVFAASTHPIMITAGAAALLFTATILLLTLAWYAGDFLEQRWNQNSYNEFLVSAKTNNHEAVENFKTLTFNDEKSKQESPLKAYSLFRDTTITRIKDMEETANQALNDQGVVTWIDSVKSEITINL